MTKKIFLGFTMMMVLIAGTLIYGRVAEAKNYQKEKTRRIEAKLPVGEEVIFTTPAPLPDAAFMEQTTPEPQETPKQPGTLTNGQKYYTSLVPAASKNILLIGKDPTYSNFDTMVIVCIDEEGELIRFIDLPRDVYIDYSEEILTKLKKASKEFFHEKGNRKLNAVPVVGRKIKYSPKAERFSGKPDMNFLADLISEIFSIEIDDYISIETDGFREMVDYFGGVYIDVPMYMHYEDPTQDLYIHFEPGYQYMNGTQAEGFVRFRQGYTREGKLENYSRSDNTFLFLKAFFRQHVTVKNLTKIGKVYQIAREHTSTSVNNIGEAYRYGRLAKKVIDRDFSMEQIRIEISGSKTVNGALYELIRTD